MHLLPHRGASPTGVERRFDESELIVTKTDTKGVITYANDVFLRVSALRERDAIGRPHSLIRHPRMPRCVFNLLWQTLLERREMFAYICNLAADGAHYWVLAHVTPSVGPDGEVTGYHSNRRVPARGAVREVERVYDRLLQAEAPHRSAKEATAASRELFSTILQQQGTDYDGWFWRITDEAESFARTAVRA
ncbi:PAS domain-containing protein [Kineococcus gynurae]|uniref:PAS domain-containing protein n=1 Tax=Kineococcus gynurae TaxID=452979 RepID=A0ABV5LXZ3_9ACTN